MRSHRSARKVFFCFPKVHFSWSSHSVSPYYLFFFTERAPLRDDSVELYQVDNSSAAPESSGLADGISLPGSKEPGSTEFPS